MKSGSHFIVTTALSMTTPGLMVSSADNSACTQQAVAVYRKAALPSLVMQISKK